MALDGESPRRPPEDASCMFVPAFLGIFRSLDISLDAFSYRISLIVSATSNLLRNKFSWCYFARYLVALYLVTGLITNSHYDQKTLFGLKVKSNMFDEIFAFFRPKLADQNKFSRNDSGDFEK